MREIGKIGQMGKVEKFFLPDLPHLPYVPHQLGFETSRKKSGMSSGMPTINCEISACTEFREPYWQGSIPNRNYLIAHPPRLKFLR